MKLLNLNLSALKSLEKFNKINHMMMQPTEHLSIKRFEENLKPFKHILITPKLFDLNSISVLGKSLVDLNKKAAIFHRSLYPMNSFTKNFLSSDINEFSKSFQSMMKYCSNLSNMIERQKGLNFYSNNFLSTKYLGFSNIFGFQRSAPKNFMVDQVFASPIEKEVHVHINIYIEKKK